MTPSGCFDAVVGSFRQVLEALPDRRTGKNTRYGMEDAALSAFSVFFTQNPSFLAHQKMMAASKGRSNAQSLFGVHQIPSDNHIRNLLDEVEPQRVFPIFEEILQVLEDTDQLSGFRAFADNLLMALDGTEYFSSRQIHCPYCSSRKLKSGEIQYFHTVVTPVIVCPGRTQVIPLVPEFVVPQDGHDKQDCENAAAKRWLTQHGQRYESLKVTALGDDLYCHQPLCELLLAQHFNFILTCQPTSHKTLYEHLEGISLPTLVQKHWTGKAEHTYTYRYLNQVPLKDGDDALLVNWCELTITDSKGKIIYQNAFATNHLLSDQTVEDIVLAGRTRWKVENENNNTLKTKGYHLEHNFGHGQHHLSAFLATLN
ncbi:MAG: ISNCY family transposase, partial [Cyanothece sp. SIO1E1]|nr:ISNCY family transposase [Cyanothece sp. SIO1E1]